MGLRTIGLAAIIAGSALTFSQRAQAQQPFAEYELSAKILFGWNAIGTLTVADEAVKASIETKLTGKDITAFKRQDTLYLEQAIGDELSETYTYRHQDGNTCFSTYVRVPKDPAAEEVLKQKNGSYCTDDLLPIDLFKTFLYGQVDDTLNVMCFSLNYRFVKKSHVRKGEQQVIELQALPIDRRTIDTKYIEDPIIITSIKGIPRSVETKVTYKTFLGDIKIPVRAELTRYDQNLAQLHLQRRR